MFANKASKAWIDHIIYVSHDLDKSITQFSEKLGVTPSIGGKHLKWGTYNALFSLGDDCYFEIVAPDPESNIRPTKFLCSTKNEGLITWVAHIPYKYKSMKEIQQYMLNNANINNGSGYDIGQIIESQRAMASDPNKILKWTLGWPNTDSDNNMNELFKNANGILPLLIDWSAMDDKSLHPSYTAPKGCQLMEFDITCPGNIEYQNVREVLYYGLEIEDRDGFHFNRSQAGNSENDLVIKCVLSTPNGTIEIVTVRDINDKVIRNEINILD